MTLYSHPPELFHARSPGWPAAERAHRRLEPVCVGCGQDGTFSGGPLAVHHVVPFHVDPARELDPANLVTVCGDHHLHVCHRDPHTGGCDWSYYDPDCRAKLDALFLRQETP